MVKGTAAQLPDLRWPGDTRVGRSHRNIAVISCRWGGPMSMCCIARDARGQANMPRCNTTNPLCEKGVAILNHSCIFAIVRRAELV